MILHVTFSDGSNPWVFYSDDRRDIVKQWKRWMKYHPDTARPYVLSSKYYCRKSVWHTGYYITSDDDSLTGRQYYKTLGHALAALDRLGGAKK